MVSISPIRVHCILPSHARVSILRPSPTNLLVLIVNRIVNYILQLKLVLDFVGQRQARKSRANADDLQFPRRKGWLLFDRDPIWGPFTVDHAICGRDVASWRRLFDCHGAERECQENLQVKLRDPGSSPAPPRGYPSAKLSPHLLADSINLNEHRRFIVNA